MFWELRFWGEEQLPTWVCVTDPIWGVKLSNCWGMSVTELMDRRLTGIRLIGEPSKGRINLRLETTWAKTSKLEHG